ncbi:MAG: hypothetical protein ACI9G9_000011 [Psychromonas sp.]|jgi:hypothetical protein
MSLKESIDHRIRLDLFILFILVGITLSCKRIDKKNPITFKVEAHIPYNDEPIAKVKYVIREGKSNKSDYLGSLDYTDFIIEGETDVNGLVNISFFPKKNMKYSYDMTFDYEGIEFKNYVGSYSIINPPNYVILTRDSQGDYKIRVLPNMPVQINFKNENCFDENDVFRYKTYNLDEAPNYLFSDNTPWLEGPALNGCVDKVGDYIDRKAGRHVFKWEATRNGVFETSIDTFLVSPGMNDRINVNW